MGYPLTTPDDYKGLIAVSTNKYDRGDLEAYILMYEQELLQDLLGCDMEAEMIADLDVDNLPQDVKFQKIFNPFCIDDNADLGFMYQYGWFYDYHPNYNGYGCVVQWRSKGILDYLRFQIYFMYTRDQQVKNTVTGNVKNENNVSIMASVSQTNMKRIYNKSLVSYWSIQWYICKNPEAYDYDNYNGLIKQPISIL